MVAPKLFIIHRVTRMGWSGVGLLAISFGSVFQVFAFEGQGREHPRHRPPEIAFEVCQARTEGDACNFDGRHGPVEGYCRQVREHPVCVPGHHPKQGREPAGHQQSGSMRPPAASFVPLLHRQEAADDLQSSVQGVFTASC